MKRKIYFLLLASLMAIVTACKTTPAIPEGTLSLSPSDTVNFTAIGGTKTVTVTTDQPGWEVISNQQWCVVKKTTPTTFEIIATPNADPTPRPEANVMVTTTGTALGKTIKVNQRGLIDSDPRFAIEITNITPKGADVKVTPLDPKMKYYYDAVSVETLNSYHDGDLATLVKNTIAEGLANYFDTLEELLAKMCTTGQGKHTYDNFSPKNNFIVFAVGLNDKGEPITSFARQDFTTAELVSDMNLTFNLSKTYFDGADFTVTSSNPKDPFYTTIRPVKRYAGMSDEKILEAILMEDGFMIPMMARTEKYTYENENVWNTNTTYMVLSFGFDANVPTTKLFKFEFRTEKSDVAPANCQFDVKVNGLTSRSANVSISPSDPKAMYLWDLISQEQYDLYKADMKAYAELYASQNPDQYDTNLSRGDGGFVYDRKLEPGTTYYVWSVCMDENAKAEAPVKVSTPFTTLPNELSNATVTANIAKYFNGDDLYAKDPVKYSAAQGKAYVPVTYTAKDAMPWYGILIAEDPKDPTSAVSDAEMANYLSGGLGIWCVVGEIYYCAWGAEHTILAVGLDSKDNYGPVVRQKHIFTKDGAAPISEFEEPKSAPFAVAKAKIGISKIKKAPKYFKAIKK